MSTQLEINNILANSGNFLTSLQVNNTGVSLTGHSHNSTDIFDFNTSVSGLLSVKSLIAGTGISITTSSGVFTINSTGGTATETIHPFLLGGM